VVRRQRWAQEFPRIASTSRRLANRAASLTVGTASSLGRALVAVRTRASTERAGLSSSGAGKPALTPADLARIGSGASNEVVDAALRLVTALAVKTIANADGVSVTLERHARLMTVAASDDAVLRMDGHQYDTGEGPCLDAKAEGHWFYIESLDDETRWPSFVPRALEQGIHSVLSSPLLTAGRPLGALNIYSNERNAFGTQEQELAALFASQASDILTTAHAQVTDIQLSSRFGDSLVARQTIAHAQGILMGRDRSTLQAATAALLRSARSADVTVLEQASRIVASVSGKAGQGAGDS
jgi:GAF domain-containing protein